MQQAAWIPRQVFYSRVHRFPSGFAWNFLVVRKMLETFLSRRPSFFFFSSFTTQTTIWGNLFNMSCCRFRIYRCKSCYSWLVHCVIAMDFTCQAWLPLNSSRVKSSMWRLLRWRVHVPSCRTNIIRCNFVCQRTARWTINRKIWVKCCAEIVLLILHTMFGWQRTLIANYCAIKRTNRWHGTRANPILWPNAFSTSILYICEFNQIFDLLAKMLQYIFIFFSFRIQTKVGRQLTCSNQHT